MGVYYVLLAVLVFAQAVGEVAVNKRVVSRNQEKKGWLLFAWLCLSLLEGLRAETVGVDTRNYLLHFVCQDWENVEPGYKLLSKVVYYFTQSPTVFLLIIALLINGLILLAIYRMSVEPFVSVYCYVSFYYYFNSYNTMRQYIAVGLLLNAFYYAKEKKWSKYFILLLLACTFHITALVGIAFVFIGIFTKDKKNISKKNFRAKEVVFLLGITAMSSLVFAKVLEMIFLYIPKFRYYIGTDYLTQGGGIQQPIVYTGLFLAALILTDASTKEHRTWLIPLSAMVCLSFLQIKIAYVVRILLYFDIYLVFVMAMIWKKNTLKGKSRVLLQLGIVVVGIAFMTYYLSLNGQGVRDYRLF